MKSETVELLDRTRGIRLSSDEDDQLETLAREAGMTVSQLIRRTLRQSLFLPADVKNPAFRAQDNTSPAEAEVGNTL